jgi:FAD/FMN-containing dehydrogenase
VYDVFNISFVINIGWLKPLSKHCFNVTMDGQKIIDILKPLVSMSTQFSLPISPKQNVGARRWTDWKSPTFCCTVKPGTVSDLQAVVEHAAANKIPFLAVASGHGYSKAYTKAKDVLEIDLGNFKAIEVDKERSTVTVGGAVQFRELFEPLYKAGKQMRMSSTKYSSGGILMYPQL